MIIIIDIFGSYPLGGKKVISQCTKDVVHHSNESIILIKSRIYLWDGDSVNLSKKTPIILDRVIDLQLFDFRL